MASAPLYDPNRAALPRIRRVLHAGCGRAAGPRLHPIFRNSATWREVRLDIDARVAPDIVCSVADMRSDISSASFDAIWSSHNIEHLYDHEVMPALQEFLRVLTPGGFALIRCPDLEAVVEAITHSGLESVAYTSPAGPIAPLDMLFGHRKSVEGGNGHMAHHTGFTDKRLGRMLIEAGFLKVLTKRAPNFDLWAVAFTRADTTEPILADLARNGLDFRR